jgi:protein-tyrosine-phosphatase
MNQARSPFAQAVLQRNFPDDRITSTGVEAFNGTPFLDAVVTLAQRWKVPITKKSSTSAEYDRNDLLGADLIITADDYQLDFIKAMGYQGPIRSYEEVINDTDFIPADPDGMTFDGISRELGKVGAVTLRAVIEAKGFPHQHRITSFIPHGISDLAMALTRGQFERVAQGAILLDADLRAPDISGLAELGLEPLFFDSEDLTAIDLTAIGQNQILIHRHQLDYPESVFLSPDWRNLVQRLADSAPIVIITAPRHSQLRKLPDSYLASYMSDEFGVISS